jgi:hypothetical protein
MSKASLENATAPPSDEIEGLSEAPVAPVVPPTVKLASIVVLIAKSRTKTWGEGPEGTAVSLAAVTKAILLPSAETDGECAAEGEPASGATVGLTLISKVLRSSRLRAKIWETPPVSSGVRFVALLENTIVVPSADSFTSDAAALASAGTPSLLRLTTSFTPVSRDHNIAWFGPLVNCAARLVAPDKYATNFPSAETDGEYDD